MTPEPDRATEGLHQAYRRTTYRVDAPHRAFPLRVGERHAEFDAWLRSVGAATWAFVTASNPRSIRLNETENGRRNQALRDAVASLGFPAWPGEGIGDDPGWPPERSLLIGGIARDEALALAGRFEQNAIVVGRLDESATLVFVVPDPDSARPVPAIQDQTIPERTRMSAEVETRVYPAERLREFIARVFESFGVPPADAAIAADVLAVSDLRGIDSHGIARLSAYYGLLKVGRLNPRPNITIVRETPSTATVDGDNGLGLVIAPKANIIAMDKADQVGTGWVAVRNTNHYGIAGWYVLEALKRDQIGWCMTNTSRITAPLWGTERMLGTNPIAIAFPGKTEPPIVIDMATTAAAFGKIEIAIRRNEEIPEGWAIDHEGRPTTDPHQMAEGGAMLPLGSRRELGGHKGYCLGAMVDILCGPLSGANWGPFTPAFALTHPDVMKPVGRGIGHFLGAMKIEAFIDADEFKTQIDEWIRTFRKTNPAPGTNGPLIPGDPEREAEAVRSREGIPLVMPVVEDLRRIAKETEIAFD